MTSMSKRCPSCNQSILKPILSCEEFKELFKVGDQIMGYSTNKIVTITAIGETKFLYFDYDKERVATMTSVLARWRLTTKNER